MNYRIITTIGPSSAEPAIWNRLVASGATGFRLNTSHLTVEQLSGWLERLEPFLRGLERKFPVVLDLQGSKWRVGQIETWQMEAGQKVEITYASTASKPGMLPVPHRDFFNAAGQSGGEVVLNDAKVRLRIESTGVDFVNACVTQGGEISAFKGITFASNDYRSENLSDKDLEIIRQTRDFKGIQYAISYLKDSIEMAHYRELIGKDVVLVAKLERRPAMLDAVKIADSADELWVCRGDLGAEVGFKDMGRMVYEIGSLLPEIQVPVIMAGQTLEHMTRSASATRSEVCYLYDTLQKGYAGFVLSDETAIGNYPVEACRTAALYRE